MSYASDEIWKPLPGYEGWYEISSNGRVKRVKKERNTYSGRIMKLQIHKDGYVFVDLCKYGIGKHVLVSRLVCEAFNGKCPDGYECNHKDGNKNNNNHHNLEWVTPKENIQHRINILGYRHLGHPMPQGSRHPRSKHYIFTDSNHSNYYVIGLKKFCRDNNLHVGAMFQIATGSGHSKHHKGWKCRYATETERKQHELDSVSK